MVRQLFQTGYILKEINATNISLIPKTKNKQFPYDLRPIALCNTSYKIISNILSSRMKKVMNKIISPLQAAYVPGRQISDNIQLAREIIHAMKKKSEEKNYLALKLVMSKAFDRLEWSFLRDVMLQMGFCEEWCNLIMQCLSTTKISILLNGAPCNTYYPSRGIGHGDPLSPYLFIIVMEAFSRKLYTAEQNHQIEGIKIAPNAPPISHLFFADDCLLFANADLLNVNNLLQIIEDFGAASGQMVNFSKSIVHFSINVPQRFCRILSRRLKVPSMNPNEKYLGIPLLIGKNKKQCFEHLQDKVKNKLSIWGSSTLSQCGKSQQIRTVTNTIPAYTMSCLQIPMEIINNINVMQRDFWHKDIGGQGFRYLKILNQAFLVRAAWRICTNYDAQWVQCMSAKYFPGTSLLHANKKTDCSWDWKGMDSPPTPRQDITDSEDYIWVEDLFLPNRRQWNEDLIYHLFQPDTAAFILQMRVPIASTDKLISKMTKNGSFTLKSAYKKLFENSLGNVQVSNFIQNTNLSWKDEHIMHVLFSCSFSRAVWMMVPGGSGFIAAATNNGFETMFENWYNQSLLQNAQSDWLNLAMVITWSNWRGSLAKCYAGVANSEKEECLALLDATIWSKELQISHIVIQTDLKNIEGYISNNSPVIAWDNETLLLDAIVILNTNLFSWKCHFIPRVCNKPADELAKFSRKFRVERVWSDIPPTVIETQLSYDSTNLST
ncbi:uncharacterized protein LOC113278906 [Papaver somniferum]|uniref:uncharacterized protein LOC113278906 n=1 Tax=Papaver somniferum TaxID=3469 RepID=UPI000E6F79EA|nr:uncharacterized protein LOC113278906 [Papaver somniferum]